MGVPEGFWPVWITGLSIDEQGWSRWPHLRYINWYETIWPWNSPFISCVLGLNEQHNKNLLHDCHKAYCCWSNLRFQLHYWSLVCDYRRDSLCGFDMALSSVSEGKCWHVDKERGRQVNITYCSRGTVFSLTWLNPNSFFKFPSAFESE